MSVSTWPTCGRSWRKIPADQSIYLRNKASAIDCEPTRGQLLVTQRPVRTTLSHFAVRQTTRRRDQCRRFSPRRSAQVVSRYADSLDFQHCCGTLAQCLLLRGVVEQQWRGLRLIIVIYLASFKSVRKEG